MNYATLRGMQLVWVLLRLSLLAMRLALRILLLLISLALTLRRWGALNPGGALGSARFANGWELFWSGVRRG